MFFKTTRQLPKFSFKYLENLIAILIAKHESKKKYTWNFKRVPFITCRYYCTAFKNTDVKIEQLSSDYTKFRFPLPPPTQ